MVTDSIRCPCGASIGLLYYELFDHKDCEAPRPPVPPAQDPRVIQARHKVNGLLVQLKNLTQRQHRHRSRRRR
jgi:hypothetical protein